jgi:hypothetical protein
MWWLGFNMSVAVAVGFIALAGVVAETGVIMLIYLDQAMKELHAERLFECHAFGIVLLEPFVRGDRIGKHLEMIGVASMVSGIDVNPNGRHWSLLSFRRPQCVSLRDELNVCSTCRFNALSMPMRACISGPRFSAAINSASIAACHSSDCRVLPGNAMR